MEGVPNSTMNLEVPNPTMDLGVHNSTIIHGDNTC